MEKLKIYLKGFSRPYAVFGYRLFEDERFFVAQIDGSKRWIPWDNLFYIESLEPVDEKEMMSEEVVATAPMKPLHETRPSKEFLEQKLSEAIAKTDLAKSQAGATVQVGDKIPITVHFTGFNEKTFAINVSSESMLPHKSPALSKEIFSEPEIRASLGGFVVKGQPRVSGSNVFIETVAPQETTTKMREAKLTLDATQKLLKGLAGGRPPNMPALGLDSAFSMPGSPFTTPMNLQDVDEDQ